MSTKILLADDHKITREGLRSLIEKQSDMEVVAEAEDGHTAVHLVRKVSPDVVIMDVSMPDLNGIEATQKIVSECPNVKVIALSMHSDTLFVTKMLKSGASGYLLKDCAFEELTRAIRTVVAGKTYLSPAISDVVVDGYLHRLSETDSASSDVLTHREREVLQMLAEGNSTKQVALKLHISVKTVETHRRQMMHKLDIYSVAELTKYAIRKGLTSLET
ncbi:MAG: response regulator transcription factor [Sedimentisphaerales bacterium]|jgi:DNA-binding NarL/FixJ family response regulator|nr:response regulator transcription factor [Sedimentisphaerales bacterium]